MGLNFTEKLGFLRAVTEFMEKNADSLKTAGFNTDIRLNELKAKNDKAAAENEKQESLKVQLREQTKAVNSAMRNAYVTASGDIDAMAGVLSKDSEISKSLRQIRSRIRKGTKEAKRNAGE